MTEYFSTAEVRGMLLDEVAVWGSQKAVAARIGVSSSYLSDVLLARRDPSPKIAAYLDLVPETRFRCAPPVSPNKED
jgi:DNA-binding transcriptional regulator YdaS (Cro superfamily)